MYALGKGANLYVQGDEKHRDTEEYQTNPQ
jgi:hypothetical protein